MDLFSEAMRRNTERSQPLWDALSRVAKLIDYQPPRSGIIYVLNLNAGDSFDITAVNSFFGSSENGIRNESVHVYSIERCTPLHEQAAQINWQVSPAGGAEDSNGHIIEPPSFFHFIHGDSSCLDELQLPGKFDAVIMRHVDSSNDQAPWQRTIHDAIELLTPEGIAIFTTRNDSAEDNPLQEFLRKQNYSVALHEHNAYAVPGMVGFSDAKITVVRKPADYATPERPDLPEDYAPGITSEINTRLLTYFPLIPQTVAFANIYRASI
jgi:hypothetical protein